MYRNLVSIHTVVFNIWNAKFGHVLLGQIDSKRSSAIQLQFNCFPISQLNRIEVLLDFTSYSWMTCYIIIFKFNRIEILKTLKLLIIYIVHKLCIINYVNAIYSCFKL